MKFKATFLALAIGVIGVNPYAWSGEHDKMSDKQQEESLQKEEAKSGMGKDKSAQKSRKFTGTILEHKVVNVFESEKEASDAQSGKKVEGGRQTLVTLVKTDKGNERLMVDLGAVENVPEIKDGETKIKAEGRLIQMGQRQLFVASKAQIGEKKLDINREKSG